jgi:ribonuclease HI
MTKAREPVKNQELIKGIDAAMAGRAVRFVKVKGHSGHPRNDQADLGCTAASAAWRDGREVPTGPGWRSLTEGV